MTANFTIQELQDACRRLKTKKSPGKDGITNEMIKNLGKYAKQKLLEVFNQSWCTGEFSAKWKEAILIPVLKKGRDKHLKDMNLTPVWLAYASYQWQPSSHQ